MRRVLLWPVCRYFEGFLLVWGTREDLRAGEISLGEEEPESDNFFLGVFRKASRDTEGQESEGHSHLARSQKSRLHYWACCENHYLLQRDHSGQWEFEVRPRLCFFHPKTNWQKLKWGARIGVLIFIDEGLLLEKAAEIFWGGSFCLVV